MPCAEAGCHPGRGTGARPDMPSGDRTATTSMLNVAGRPFLDTLIDEIARYDAFEEILLLAGHQAEPILARYAGAVRGRARLTGRAGTGAARDSGCAGSRRRSVAEAFSASQRRFIFRFQSSRSGVACRLQPRSYGTARRVIGDRSAPCRARQRPGSLVHRARPRRNRSGQCRGLRHRPVDHCRHRPPPRFARTGRIARARRQRRHEAERTIADISSTSASPRILRAQRSS